MRTFTFMAVLLLLALIACPAGAGVVAEYRFDDGKGSTVARDHGPQQRHAHAAQDGQGHVWAWDDYHGAFLQFNAQRAPAFVAPAHASQDLTQDFAIDLVFSVDLSKTAPTKFMALAGKGVDYKDQWVVMVREDGAIMFYLAGLDRPYHQFKHQVQSNHEHAMTLARQGQRLNLYIDGKLVESRTARGQGQPGHHPLAIGGLARYPMAGTLKLLRLRDDGQPPASAVETQAVTASQAITHSADAIVFTDFAKMTPRDLIADEWTINKYVINRNRLEKASATLDLPDLAYDPALVGRYDLYIGLMRRANIDNGLRIKTTDMQDWRRVELPMAEPGGNSYADVLWARDVEMKGQRIHIGNISDRYTIITHLKFVPARQDAPQPDPQVVTIQDQHVHGRIPQQRVASGVVVERFHVDDTPLPVWSQADRERGFVVSARHWMELVFSNTRPVGSAASPSLQGQSAKGQDICLAYSAFALRDIDHIEATLAKPLANAQGKTLPVSLGFIRALNKRYSGYRGKGEFMNVPLYVEPMRPLALAREQSFSGWVNVQVPQEAQPGVYEGVVRVAAKGGASFDVPLAVTVLPFVLEPLRETTLGFFTQLHAGNEPQPNTMAAMKRVGLNAAMPFIHNGSGVRVIPQGDDVKLDFSRSLYEKAFRQFVASGMTGKLYVHWPQHGGDMTDYLAKLADDDAAYTRALRSVLTQLHNHALACGLKPEQIIYYVHDEILSQRREAKSYRDLLIFKQMGLTVSTSHLWRKTHRPQAAELAAKYYHELDEVIIRYSNKPIWYVDPWPVIESQAKADGKRLMHYNYTNGLAFPELETMRFATGWFYRTLGRGASGALLWNYDLSRLNPRDDLDGQNTDWVYIYSPEGEDRGGPALLLEAMREGITDLRHIEMLERLSESAPPAQSAKARQLIDEIAGSIDVERIRTQCSFLESSWEKAWEDEQGIRRASGRLAMPTGWSFAEYDRQRARLAAMIIELTTGASR